MRHAKGLTNNPRGNSTFNIQHSTFLFIRLFMNSRYGSAARVVLVLERGIPRQGFGCRAGYAWHARHTLGSAVAWEMLGEDRAIIILLLVLWRIDRESLGSMCHLFVADG